VKLKRCIVKNFRCLRNADLSFGDRINIVVGDNEAGKSTLLEAINLALRGQINRRPAAFEIHPFMFNQVAVREFLEAHKSGNPVPPPEIRVELYFDDDEALGEFKGLNNTKADDQANGLYFSIALDEENFGAEYAAYIADTDALTDIPIEYYTTEWRSFAWGASLTPQAIPLKSAFIDPSAISNTYAANKYVVEIVRDYLSPQDRVDLALSYRGMRAQFHDDARISAINKKLKEQSTEITEKTLSIAMDVTTRASWETGVLPHLNEIPLNLVGKGEQNSVKIKLALAAADQCHLVLMEEPENHLSHGNLGRLIKHISDNCEEQQIIVTTHSSYVLNKLGVESVIMFDGENSATLEDLPPDTLSYFKRLPGHDTLRMILAQRSILVEGPSDELIVQKGFKQQHGMLPLEAGVEVISVGTSFKRFLDIAMRLSLRVAVVRDNDGDAEGKLALFKNYSENQNIAICIDNDDEARTLEPQLVKANGRQTINKILGTDFVDDAGLLAFMEGNKTDVALKLFESNENLAIPEYIQGAIG
jgi:putative ATP-dependent endonuclease of the OLD family